jgi:protein-tyrosine phosphatase
LTLAQQRQEADPLMGTKARVLFVCMGNICRSPTAAGVFRHLVHEANLEADFMIDSAGTSWYHIGDPPDERSVATARRRGVLVEGKARAFTKADLNDFDYIIVMDEDNREGVLRLADGQSAERVRLLREFDADAQGELDVPDPYYGGSRGFDNVFDIIERSCRALLARIQEERGL